MSCVVCLKQKHSMIYPDFSFFMTAVDAKWTNPPTTNTEHEYDDDFDSCCLACGYRGWPSSHYMHTCEYGAEQLEAFDAMMHFMRRQNILPSAQEGQDAAPCTSTNTPNTATSPTSGAPYEVEVNSPNQNVLPSAHEGQDPAPRTATNTPNTATSPTSLNPILVADSDDEDDLPDLERLVFGYLTPSQNGSSRDYI